MATTKDADDRIVIEGSRHRDDWPAGPWVLDNVPPPAPPVPAPNVQMGMAGLSH